MTALEYALMLEREAMDLTSLVVALHAVDAALARKASIPYRSEDEDDAPCGQGCVCPSCINEARDEEEQINRFAEVDEHDDTDPADGPDGYRD